MKTTEATEDAAERVIVKMRFTGSTQKSSTVDFKTFLPYILGGDAHVTSPGSEIWWDKDWSQPIIQLLSQEHLHGLPPMSNVAEMFTVAASLGNDWSIFLRKFAKEKWDTSFKTSTVISDRAQLLTSKTDALSKYGRRSRRRRSLLLEKSSLYLT